MEKYKGKVQQKDVQRFLEDHLARAILFQPTKRNFCYQIPFHDAHRHDDWEVTPLTRHADVFFHADLFYFCGRIEEAIDEVEKLNRFLDAHPKLYKPKDREVLYKEINEAFALYSQQRKTDVINEIKRSSGDTLLSEAKKVVHDDRSDYLQMPLSAILMICPTVLNFMMHWLKSISLLRWSMMPAII